MTAKGSGNAYNDMLLGSLLRRFNIAGTGREAGPC